MHADVAFSDRYHRPAFQLVSHLIEDLMEQCGDVGTAKTFSSDADHRRGARATDGQEAMEVRIQGNYQPSMVACMLGDFHIRRAAQADVSDMTDIDALVLEMANSTAWQALIQQ